MLANLLIALAAAPVAVWLDRNRHRFRLRWRRATVADRMLVADVGAIERVMGGGK